MTAGSLNPLKRTLAEGRPSSYRFLVLGSDAGLIIGAAQRMMRAIRA